tara:strand:- start:5299 stop:5859 length:561 start_codon:yes stop_codon:yes gene_type:complete
MTVNRTDYMKEYYEQNKDRILKSRKVRYDNDPSYRGKLARNRSETRRRFKELERLKLKKKSIESGEEFVVESGKKMKVKTPTGKTAVVHMYTLGQVCDIVKVKKASIINWINSGKLPESLYRNHVNWRLYTDDQVLALKNVIDAEMAICIRNKRKLRMTSKLASLINEKFNELEFGVDPEKLEEDK